MVGASALKKGFAGSAKLRLRLAKDGCLERLWLSSLRAPVMRTEKYVLLEPP